MGFRKDHIFPTVRIQKIEMENFKSVRYGEIVLNGRRKVIQQDTGADILGIYGRNGSGKTSVIEAIDILKKTMGGYNVSAQYSECIASGADFAKLTFVFDLKYAVDVPYSRTVTYSFKIEAIPNEKYKEDTDTGVSDSAYPKKVRAFDEVISVSGLFDGEIQNKQPILITTLEKYPIGSVRKHQEYVGAYKDEAVVDSVVNQRTAAKDSKSYIFLRESLDLFYQHSNYSEYFQVLLELNRYANTHLYVADLRTSVTVARAVFMFNLRKGLLPLNLMGPSIVRQSIFEDLEYYITEINIVLPALVEDMQLILEHKEVVYENKTVHEVTFFSKRKDTLIPLRDESAGIIKLVSILSLVIAAFNDSSVTVAIDELDAGIDECLLEKIFIGLETYGKGQFIFTSHSIRLLEVLKKESHIITTSNPHNRYIPLKGVDRTYDMRNLYGREIRDIFEKGY